MKTTVFFLGCLSGGLQLGLLGGVIVPTGYIATPGEGTAQGGSFDYFDDTGSQLTDGVYGDNIWFADLGNGEAYEWVAWRYAEPSITFAFAGSPTIIKVTIDFNRDENAAVWLPTTVTIGGTAFSMTRSEIPEDTRGSLDFYGLWTGPTLVVDLFDGDDQFIFVDEISFAEIPESGFFGGVAAVGLAALILKRRLTQG